jgi:hypothetical protein
MSTPRRRFDLPPRRGMNVAETAAYLGCPSTTCFVEHRSALEAAGFPRPLPLLETYDRIAIDRWLDEQGGSESALRNFSDAWMKAATNA